MRPRTKFELSEEFEEFYMHYEEQDVLPRLLNQRMYDPEKTKVAVARGETVSEPFGSLRRVEVVLFALPMPVAQVVGTLVIDLDEEAVGDQGRVKLLRDAMIHEEITLNGESIVTIVDKLFAEVPRDQKAGRAGVFRRIFGKHPENHPQAWPRFKERHVMMFAQPTGGTARPDDIDPQARQWIEGAHFPHEPEFTKIYTPKTLNQGGHYTAISHYASVLFGLSGRVNSSVLLITTQTVGTAARFQEIWQKAYGLVSAFQQKKNSETVGEETRDSLGYLADQMGNLELNLTFNVQTSVDLGLGSTTAFVDSFHRNLHKAMRITKRADTVADMFQRVNSSIQSELTAIVSHERDTDEKRRRWGTVMIGVLTVVVAPMTLILGFFGMSTADILPDTHYYYFQTYHRVYELAGGVTVAAVALAFLSLFLFRDSGRRKGMQRALRRQQAKDRRRGTTII